jgi:predicted  nucleic acid-binding Zn-ribbon protein
MEENLRKLGLESLYRDETIHSRRKVHDPSFSSACTSLKMKGTGIEKEKNRSGEKLINDVGRTSPERIDSLIAEIAHLKSENVKLTCMLKRTQSDLRVKEYRIGTAGEEISQLKNRIKDILTKSDTADRETELTEMVAKQRKEKLQLKSLNNTLSEYIKNVTAYNQVLLQLKHVDVSEAVFEKEFLITY